MSAKATAVPFKRSLAEDNSILLLDANEDLLEGEISPELVKGAYIVHKFGGSSVGNPKRLTKVLTIIKELYEESNKDEKYILLKN